MTSTLYNTPLPAAFNQPTTFHAEGERAEKNWLGALHILAQFASLDTMQYASLLLSIERHNQDISKTDNHRYNTCLMKQVEVLRKDKAFRDTPIPQLVEAMHRFHSNLAHWHEEDSNHVHEIRHLQEALAASRVRERKLTKECKKLTKQTTQLRSKLREKRNVLAKAKAWFRESAAERETLLQTATVAQLQVHEHFMTSGRIRLGSTDSNFSDVDALNYAEVDNTTNDSIEESESQSSLVTDDGVATLRFTMEESFPRIASVSSTYTLQFPTGIKTGMRIKAVPISEWKPFSKPALSRLHLDDSGVEMDETPQQDEANGGFAFVVSGHHQVESDDESAVKIALPPVGARILAIRNQKVTQTWTLSAVLASMTSTADQKPTFSVTFRNGRLASKQSCSDDDSVPENQFEPQRNMRPFNLLQFGKKDGSKVKEDENRGGTEQESIKFMPHKGSGNALMFWRHDHRYADQGHDRLPEVSFEETRGEAPNEHLPELSSNSVVSFVDGEGADKEKTGKANGIPLIFWKKDEGVPRKNAADLVVGLRSRLNTADSCGITEATAASKEDASVVSCPEAKTGDHLTSISCHQKNVNSSSTTTTPMNHLMFWRKNEAEEEPEESELKMTDSDVKDQDISLLLDPATPAGAAVSTKDHTSNDKPLFRLDFWNNANKLTPRATKQMSSVAEAGAAAEAKDMLTPVSEVFTEHVTELHKDDLSESQAVADSSKDDGCSSCQEDSTLEVDLDGGAHSLEQPLSETITSSTKEATSDLIEESDDAVTAHEQHATCSILPVGEDLASSRGSGNSPINENKGPMQKMTRFFSNPFNS